MIYSAGGAFTHICLLAASVSKMCSSMVNCFLHGTVNIKAWEEGISH
jgi:hypothetical protein